MASLRDLYPMPDLDKHWSVPQQFDATFDFEYDDGRSTLMHLYQKGKDMQWDAVNRIDWSLELDFENPMQLPDEGIALHGSPMWEKMTKKERIEFRRHAQSWNISQFMQGEQAALICAAKIVESVPDLDAKFYAATQVMDEARHVEAYKNLMKKFGVAYPMTEPLRQLVDEALRDSRWDFTYLAMQVVIEGLALAAFGTIRDLAQNPLAKMVNAYVMEDEARHVAFGRLSLRDYYPHLTQAERDEREEFLVEACYHMRDRFQAREVYEVMGLPVEECIEWAEKSEMNQLFRTLLFQRIVPVVKDIGLWGPKIQKAYADMGVLHYADQDLDLLAKQDEEVARDLDTKHQDVRTAYVQAVAGHAE
ncbi:MAG: ferritin-like domain-containing protein [Alphaproteobacteria bacterium]|uniref:ferritin-like domain-containing protein n=1 Tax=Maricaulis alexandrii TaxID=2570354 RepID=UPI001109BDFB|nr:ferritin-like domain-containing protein [Maricaulis alexandrii]MCR9266370.1 ferritin-like domain-containing protein [Alphaproteobacteria bacterium]